MISIRWLTQNIENSYEQYKRLEFLEKLNCYIHLENSDVLDFGSATGHMTEILLKIAKRVVAVDGSKDFIEIAQKRVKNFGNVKFYESYFENFQLDEKFDCLVLFHIFEHIENPIPL